MAEVSKELINEVLKQMQDRLALLGDGQRDIREELRAMRAQQLATQTDVSNIYHLLSGVDRRIERIGRRLELHDHAAG